jgi:hypothetical protein
VLDGDHGGHRAAAHILRIALQGNDAVFSLKRHGLTIEQMHQRNEQTQRQQDAGDALDKVVVEVAQLAGAALFQ